MLVQESPSSISALDAAEVIESYSRIVAGKLHPDDMKKPILTTNISKLSRNTPSSSGRPSGRIYSNPHFGNAYETDFWGFSKKNNLFVQYE